MEELVSMEFTTVTLMICLLIFIITNSYFDKKVRRLFLIACLLVLCLVFADSVEYWTATFDHATSLRIWMSAIGYSIRPVNIYIVILLLIRQREKKIKWLSIPLILNALIAFSALFTGIAYSYSEDNQFVRGPIGYFAFVTSGLYTVILLVFTIKQYKAIHWSETVTMIIVVSTFVIATAMESILGYDGMINASGAVAIVFYYLYLNTQQFKRDPMTLALNRRCFFLDGGTHEASLSAVMSIDLNDLKKWNDVYGHAKGDDAICTLAQCVQMVIPKKCYLYRTGGDEFMVLCFEQNKEEVCRLISDIKRKIEKTPYSCAIGMAYKDQGQNLQELCSQADREMYRDKARMKQEAGHWEKTL